MQASNLFVCVFLLFAVVQSSAQSTVLTEVVLNQNLFPGSVLSQELSLDSAQFVKSVALLTDWWQKRPTEIRVYKVNNGVKGELITLKQFLKYDDMVCGDNFDEKCVYPENPVGRLTVPLNKLIEKVLVEVDGLLSVPNEYAILKSLQLLG
eukprot:TRINITY_DN28221_c0_g4_i1.p2 TRINITY_DN28221_c0_g4~~TRINITY_DN28221_c0_g4_i1.p2  ORF type:complete len:151 (-),score=12.92 TRINITY_DN28221_c0_g4_i1:505-957(-)